MKMYYSNLGASQFTEDELPEVGVLFSYYGLSKIKIPAWSDSYFLDSGAFSAWRQNIEIDLDKYIKFLHEHKDEVDIYASLDVIGDARASYINYIEMKKQGLDPLPCYHEEEDMTFLFRYADQTNYIALGGISMSGRGSRIAFLNSVFHHFPDRNKVGFHGFGIAAESVILNYPWQTVDSSAVHHRARFGAICTPFINCVVINPDVQSQYKIHQSRDKLAILKKWVVDNGFDWDMARERTPAGIKERCRISIFYYEGLMKKVPREYESKVQYLF